MKDEIDMTTEQLLREYYKSYYSEIPSASKVRIQVIARLNSQPPHSLLRRISSRMLPVPLRFRTAFISTLLVAVLLAGVLVTVSPARTWAQDTISGLMTYFGFNRSTPLSPEGKTANHPAGSGTVATNCVKAASGDMYCASAEEIYITQAQGQEKLGFKLKAPSYVPGGYVDLKIFLTNPKEKWSIWTAESKDNRGSCGLQPIRLQQWPASIQPKGISLPVGDAPAQAVTIAGSQGLWIEKVEGAWCSPAEGNRIMRTTNFLSWEAESVRYTLYLDSSLGINEAIKIAETLK